MLVLLAPLPALASSSFELETISDKHHITADRTLYHSREKVYEAFGHVVVSSRGQRLSADYLWVDEKTKDMKARGNVIFVDKKMTVQAAEINFNLNTGVGSIFYGKVFNDFYTLKGQLIRRVSEDRYLTTEGEYTTCKDCAESWKLSARYVDLTVEGYAFLNSVYVKINDVPTLYVPYVVLPVKTKRQTGLLFPRMGASTNNGFMFVQPAFLAIDSHQDATVSAGRYSARGSRFEGEYRYKSFNGIAGTFNIYRTEDRRGESPRHARTAIKADNAWPISKHLEMRWRVREVMDRDYVIDFPEDMDGYRLPALESNANANLWYGDFYLSAEAKRYRNLLHDKRTGFDGATVQALPTVHAALKERHLLGPIMGGFYGRYDNFTRHNGPFSDRNANRLFDLNFSSTLENPELIREANRFIFSPELSAPFRIGPYLNIGPSAQYNEIRYNFSPIKLTDGNSIGPTYTRYLQTRLEASAVLERVYDYNGQKVSRVKHQMAPFVTFSYIPWIRQDDKHPFRQQVNQRSEGLFDQFDIVPLTNSTSFLRYPQGRSIYYGVTSRLIRKLKRVEDMPREYPYDLLPTSKPKVYPQPFNRKQELKIEEDKLWDNYNPRYEDYQEIWNVRLSQAYDFIEARNQERSVSPDKTRAFSYVQATSSLGIDQFSHTLEYRYFPRIVTPPNPPTTTQESVYRGRHYVATNLAWSWVNRTNLRRTRSFVRQTRIGYTNANPPSPSRTAVGALEWSLNDFTNVKLDYNFDLLAKSQIGWAAVTNLTHPSECWGLSIRYDWRRDRAPKHYEVGFQLLLNLDGTGFMSTSDRQQQGGVFGGL